MARHVHKLSPLAVRKTAKPGMHGDGGGLWLQVSPSLSKSWVFRYMLAGKAREMGLGSYLGLSLADARERAADCRKQLLDGHDPIDRRKALLAAARLQAVKSRSFEECATAYIKDHKSAWRNPKHVSQWENTLRDYAHPMFGKVLVSDIDTALVLKALEPIWTSKPETASRLRGRIEAILDWATVRQYRKGDNPARWKGHLSQLLPKHSKVATVEHHAALPYSQLPAFLVALRAATGIAARALEFAILTAGRTGEVIGAKWDEFELEGRVWTIPPARMKAQREHRVPLSSSALRLLKEATENRQNEFVFPGSRLKKPLSNMAMLKVLERLKREDLTVHGFRSTFRDWAAETTDYSHEVVEMALAHTIGNKVEAAYRRGDLFAKRATLMEAWAAFLENKESPRATVIEMRSEVRERVA